MKNKLTSIGAVVLLLALLFVIAPACGNGEEEVPTPGFTPSPGTTPTPGVTPTPTPEVKTIKFGLLAMLSGPGAQWGLEIEKGMEWAVDKINDAGGFKVGADTYMIKVEKGDSAQGAVFIMNELTRMIHDEGIHYLMGPIGETALVAPTVLEGKCFTTCFTNDPIVGPHNPYLIMTAAPVHQWYRAFWDQAYQYHPEINTVAVMRLDLAQTLVDAEACKAAHEAHGSEVVMMEEYAFGLTDFYPVLTRVVAKNPDCVDLGTGLKGDQDLMVKQIRELGYEGLLAGPAHGDPQSTIEIAGANYAEGFAMNDPDYGSDLYPESVQQLWAEFQQLYPGEPMATTTVGAYASTFLYVQAMQAAGSTDPDEVMKVLDDPNFEFEWFGQSGKHLGGYETFGIRRCIQDEVCYSEVVNGEKVMFSRQPIVIP